MLCADIVMLCYVQILLCYVMCRYCYVMLCAEMCTDISSLNRANVLWCNQPIPEQYSQCTFVVVKTFCQLQLVMRFP